MVSEELVKHRVGGLGRVCFGQQSLWLELYEIKGKSIFEAIGKHNFQLFSLFPVTIKLRATNLRTFSLLSTKQMVTRFLFSSSIKQHEIFNKLSKQLRVL